MRDLDLLVIDDVHFLGGKKATQEEFLHTFNAIEAMGRQVVMASDDHPKMIEEFGESLINRFVSGMVVRIDPPNFATRCEILRALARRGGMSLSRRSDRLDRPARDAERPRAGRRDHPHRRPRQAHRPPGRCRDGAGGAGRPGSPARRAGQARKTSSRAVCDYFGLEHKDLMSGRRQRTISLARSVAMFLVRKTAKLSFPEIGIAHGQAQSQHGDQRLPPDRARRAARTNRSPGPAPSASARKKRQS